MTMKDRLTSSFVDVDTHIVAVRMETLVIFLLHILKNYVHCLALMVSEIKI